MLAFVNVALRAAGNRACRVSVRTGSCDRFPLAFVGCWLSTCATSDRILIRNLVPWRHLGRRIVSTRRRSSSSSGVSCRSTSRISVDGRRETGRILRDVTIAFVHRFVPRSAGTTTGGSTSRPIRRPPPPFGPDLPLLFRMHEICLVDSQENY